MIQKITLQIGPSSIGSAVLKALAMAIQYECPVSFQFNKVECVLEPEDSPSKMVEAYNKAFEDESPGKKVAFGNGTYDITT